MKLKIIIALIIIILISNMGGCSNNLKVSITENEAIIIDEDTKSTSEKGKQLNISKVATFEDFLSPNYEYENDNKKTNYEKDINSQITFMNGNILFFKSKEHSNTIQFPEFKIQEASIGEISLDSPQDDKFNDIKWRDISTIEGTLLTGYLEGVMGIRINKDNKIYSMNSNGILTEIKSYQKIFEKGINPIHFVESDDGRFDVFEVSNSQHNRSVYIIDSKNDKYYDVSLNDNDEFSESYMRVVGIEDNKVYVKFIQKENGFRFGYIEQNTFKEIISSETDLKIKLNSNMIYSNGHILFLGEVTGKSGLYNMDLSNNTMKIEYPIDGYGTLKINPQGDKIAISTSKLENVMDGNSNGDFGVYIAKINNNLGITNLSTIHFKTGPSFLAASFKGWSENGDLFYLYKHLEESDNININKPSGYYEVYKIDH